MNDIDYKKLFALKRKIKIAIVGSRNFDNYTLFLEKIDPVFIKLSGCVDVIVSGGAKGTDTMAEIYARDNNINTLIFKPDWEKHGNSAGIIRNRTIIKNSDMVIAFVKGNSKGTKNSIKVAEKFNKELIVFTFS